MERLEDRAVPSVVDLLRNPGNVPIGPNESISSAVNQFVVTFSDPLQPDTVNDSANWELRAAGPDTVLNTADDTFVGLSPTSAYSSGTAVTLNVQGGNLPVGLYQFTVFAGAVTDNSGNLNGQFTRPFRFVLPSANESEPNNDFATAKALTLVEGVPGSGFYTSAIAVGALDPAGEADYWSFQAQAGDRLVVDLERTSGNFTPRFIVYNAAGQALVDSSSWGGGFGSPSKTTNSVFTVPATGTYYLWTRDYSGGSGAGLGSYQLRLDLGRAVQLEPYDYNFANNSTAGASNFPLTVSGNQRFGTMAGSLYSQEGVDYYKIGTANPGETIFVSTRLPSVSVLSPAVEIRDERDFYWNERTGGRSFDGVAEVAVTETHTYYAVIRPNSGMGIRGQYLLDVQVVPTGSLDFPDLVATDVSAPGTALSGDDISVSWTVKNVGHASTLVGGWTDQVLLSQDAVLGNGDDVFLASFAHSGALAVDASYQQTRTVRLPEGISGSYRVFVKVDADNAVNEFVLVS
jgi:hypothetical protein